MNAAAEPAAVHKSRDAACRACDLDAALDDQWRQYRSPRLPLPSVPHLRQLRQQPAR